MTERRMRRAKAAVPWLLPLSIIFLATTIKVIVATQYTSQIIAVMGDTDIESKAANFLYDKNPGVSTIVSWNNDNNTFEYEKGKILDYFTNATRYLDFRKVRIQVVGHGDVFGNDDTLSGKPPRQVADALNTLYPYPNRAMDIRWAAINDIARVSVVCCNCTYQSANAGESFASSLVRHLKESYYIVASVTARNFLVSIDSTGDHLTGMMDSKDNITWEHKDPKANTVYTYNPYNPVNSNGTTYEGDPITCKLCGITSYGLIPHNNTNKTENGVTLSVRLYSDEVPSALVTLTQKALYDLIDNVTQVIFDNAGKGKDGLWHRTAIEQRFIIRERKEYHRVGQPVQVWSEDIERRLRMINSLQDFVNEINYYGRKGPQQPGEIEYYKFGDFVISMNTSDYQSNGSLAVVLIEVPQDEPSPLPVDRMNELVATSPYNWIQTDDIPKIGVEYSQLMNVDSDFFYDMKAFMTGKPIYNRPDFTNLESSSAKATTAQRALSMTLQESIRNFRTHMVNMIALDLNEHHFLNYNEFFDSHPMARWGTWPPDERGENYPNPTGYRGTYGGYSWNDLEKLVGDQRTIAFSVRQRMANFLAEWLSKLDDENIEIESYKGMVYLERIDESQQGDINNTIIDDVSSNSTDSEVAGAVQRALLNLVEDSNDTATIIRNANVGGKFLSSTSALDSPEIETVHQKVQDLEYYYGNYILQDSQTVQGLSEGIYDSASLYNNTITDNAGDNMLVGYTGSDTIILTKGYDIAKGGPGFDFYDLNNATGTKIIVNYADDLEKDVVLMNYTSKGNISFGRPYTYYDLVIRVAYPGYPDSFFDAAKPTVIISNWFLGEEYQHIEFVTHDGVVTQDLVEASASDLNVFTLKILFGDDDE